MKVIFLILFSSLLLFGQPDSIPRMNTQITLEFTDSMSNVGFDNPDNFIVYKPGGDTMQIVGLGVIAGDPLIGFKKFIVITLPVEYDVEYRVEVYNVYNITDSLINPTLNFAFTQLRHSNVNIGKPVAVRFGEPLSFTGFTVLINAGGENYFDTSGRLWSADYGFVGGNVVNRGNIPIANTNDEEIYRTERYGMDFYNIAVPNGRHQIILHFAETFSGITGNGQRVFTVIVEGIPYQNLDIYNEAGGRNIALTIDFGVVIIADGEVNLTFNQGLQQALINGIEIKQLN